MIEALETAAGSWWYLQSTLLPFCLPAYQAFSILPYLMFRYSGVVLLGVSVAMAIFLIGPQLFMQTRLGVVTRMNIVTLIGRHIPIFKGVAVGLMFITFMSMSINASVGAYSLATMHSLNLHPLSVVTSCANIWNTEKCLDNNSPPVTEEQNFTSTYYSYENEIDYSTEKRSPVFEFFRNVIAMAPYDLNDQPLEEMGSIVPHLVGALFGVWMLVFLTSAWGVAIYGYIGSVLNGICLLLLVIVTFIGYLDPAASEAGVALHYFFFPVPSYFNEQIIYDSVARMTYAIFLLSALSVSFGKFTGKGAANIKIVSYTSWIQLLAPAILLLIIGPISVAPFVAAVATHHGTSIGNVMNSGFDFIYVTMVEGCALMDRGSTAINAFLFMILLFTINVMSYVTIILVDCLMEGFFDDLVKPWLPKKFFAHVFMSAALCFIAFLCSLPYAMTNGMPLMTCLDMTLHVFTPSAFIFILIGLAVAFLRQSEIDRTEKIIVCLFGSIAGSVAMGLLHKVISEGAVIYSRFNSDTCQTAGWLSALLPFVIGVIGGFVEAFVRAKGGCGQRMKFMVMGEYRASSSSQMNEMTPVVNRQEEGRPIIEKPGYGMTQ